MESPNENASPDPRVTDLSYRGPETAARTRGDLAAVIGVATAVIVAHVVTNGRYGLHGDELQVLDDARHLAWGFVAYPPLTPFIERLALVLSGHSIVGLRMFSVLGQGAVLILTGMMARELGAGRVAQIVGALAVATSPGPMFEATEFQYSSFDMLWWVLIAYFLIRLLKTENPRWWIGIGAAIGAGLMTKYTMAFDLAGMAGGVLLTPSRRYLRTPWLWIGAAFAALIFAPNLLWQIRHHFVSLRFLRHIHTRDVGMGLTQGFVPGQFIINTNPLLAPLWIAGLLYFFAGREGQRYRLLGWLYVIPLATLFFAKGKMYYIGPAYPMLFAAGSVLWQHLLECLSIAWSRALEVATFAAIAVGGAFATAMCLPIRPLISPHNPALEYNPALREEIGWTDLVAAVAKVRDSLPAGEREHLAILTGNYGETGAIDFYGPAYGLPQAIIGTNTAWYRGYGDSPPETLIVLGLSRRYVDAHFASCRLAGHNGNPYGVKNQESQDNPDIFVCGPPLAGWPAFWSHFQRFG